MAGKELGQWKAAEACIAKHFLDRYYSEKSLRKCARRFATIEVLLEVLSSAVAIDLQRIMGSAEEESDSTVPKGPFVETATSSLLKKMANTSFTGEPLWSTPSPTGQPPPALVAATIAAAARVAAPSGDTTAAASNTPLVTASVNASTDSDVDAHVAATISETVGEMDHSAIIASHSASHTVAEGLSKAKLQGAVRVEKRLLKMLRILQALTMRCRALKTDLYHTHMVCLSVLDIFLASPHNTTTAESIAPCILPPSPAPPPASPSSHKVQGRIAASLPLSSPLPSPGKTSSPKRTPIVLHRYEMYHVHPSVTDLLLLTHGHIDTTTGSSVIRGGVVGGVGSKAEAEVKVDDSDSLLLQVAKRAMATSAGLEYLALEETRRAVERRVLDVNVETSRIVQQAKEMNHAMSKGK